MLKPALHNLFAHKVRLLLTALSVVLGVAFVAGTLIFTDTMDKSIDKLFDTVTADVSVSKRSELSADVATTTVPASLVDTVADVDGVTDARGTIFVDGVFLVDADNEVLGSGGAPTFGTNWDSDRRAYGAIQLVDGGPPSAPNEIVIDKASADRFDLEIGSSVSVLTPGPRVDATLVGLFTYGESEGLGSTTVAFETERAQELFLSPGEFSVVEATAEGASDAELTQRVQAAVGPEYEAKTAEQTSEEIRADLDQILGIFRTILLVFGAIALFVGIFIILNTFTILVSQRTRELALFRAVGASRRQVTRSVLLEAVIIGVIGATLGLLLGYALAAGLRALMASFGADFGDSSLQLAPRTILIGYLIGLLVTIIAAYVPARRAAQIPPVAALRDNVSTAPASLRGRLGIAAALTVAGVGSLIGGFALGELIAIGLGVAVVFVGVIVLMPLIAGPVVRVLGKPFTATHGAVGKLARENAMRNPRHTAVTAGSLMVGLALVAAISVIAASLKSTIGGYFDDNVTSDYQVINSTGVPFSSEIGEELAATPGVEQVVRQQWVPAKLGDDDISVTGMTLDGLASVMRVTMVEGSKSALPNAELLINEDTAKERDLTVGDTITLAFSSGQRALRVDGVFENNELLGSYLLGSAAATELSGRSQDNLLLLKTTSTDPATRAALEGALAPYPNVTIQDQQEAKEYYTGQVDQLLLIIWALLALAIIIAIIGIINTLVLSVYERTREIGLLRAVGLGRRGVRQMIRLESVVICVFGAIVGVLLGVAFGTALVQALADQGFETLSIPWLTSPWYQSLLFFVLLAALIGVLAAMWPARRAAKLDVIQAVTTE